MAQEIDLKIKGLYTHPNTFSEVPEGALTIADNVVIDRESVAEVRRGVKLYGNAGSFTNVKSVFEFKDKLIVHADTELKYDWTGDGSSWTVVHPSTSEPESGTKIHTVTANQNLYLTTSTGIKKLDNFAGTFGNAGAPRGLSGEAALTGASGFLANNTQVAYRIVWGRKDSNKNLVLGAPSQRIVVSNSTGGTRDVNVTFSIPSGITTVWFYQVYRSAPSAGSAIEPNDEMYLVYENNPTAGEITAKSVTVTDSVPTDLTGATLYTSPSQEGIENANEEPPFAKDITVFKNHTLYANTKTKHRLYLTIISVGGTGLAINDTVTISGVTYTGKGAENIPADEFLVYTAGTPAQNIDTTARSLVKVINQSTSTTNIYAYYISGYDDLPGQILLEERVIGGSSFAATSSNGSAYSPVLPTSGTTISSENDTKVNRVYVSKPDEPEAVPLLNYIDVGSADDPIKRIIALRESTFIFKTDGIFRLTGTTFSNFSVDLFDNTASLLAPESAVVFNNQVFMFSDQGIAAVSDGGGVAIVSRPIEKTLLELSSSQYTNFASATHAVAYESDRKYILFTISATTDTYATQAFVYNAFTGGWTRWTLDGFVAGLVKKSNDKLYLLKKRSGTASVYVERKDFALSDFADEQNSCTIVSSSGTTLTVSSTNGISAGWTIKQGFTESIVVSVDSATQFTMQDEFTWSAGAATAYQPIQAVLQWVPQYGGNPSALKHFSEITLLFDDASFRNITVGFTNSFTTAIENVVLTSNLTSAWGLFPWGSLPWGSISTFEQPIRTYVPREIQRCMWLNVRITMNQAFSRFGMAGLSVMFRPISTRIK